ncbi:MAG: methylated-DNA--[protein]-cysteine S-methyltransferase, partial [Flavisolibacter sp.]
MQFFSHSYASPLGNLLIRCSADYISTVSFMEEADEPPQDQHKLIDTCIIQLDEYFSGTRKIFTLPLGQDGTEFQKKIWELLCAIPYGKTISYQALSKQYGDTKAIRAVASANGRNNIAIIVPCHRVIGSNQTL